MGKKGKRVMNMQRRPSHKQQAQVQAEAQASNESGGTENTTYFVHGPHGIHAQQENGEWKWMAQDGLSSVRSVIGNDVSVHQSISYDPFGNPIDVVGSEETMYGYTGEPTDENGLVYLRNRYYNPNMGTFISRDTYEGSMNNAMSLNGYSYVQGNPVNMTDPSGMIPVHAINNMMQSNPLAFAQMMNAGVCLAQTDPCAGYAGQSYIDCRQGLLPTMPPTPTPFLGTSMPFIYHVPCNFTNSYLNVRREPSLLAPIVNIVNNPAGVELQLSSYIASDTYLGGTGWWYANSLGGWVHDSNLAVGPSPCPRMPTLVTPTPQPTIPSSIPTPSPSDLNTISRVINCEANGVVDSINGIAHAIYNRMTSGVADWANYRTALSIIQNTGVDCYTNNRYLNPQFSPTGDSNAAARWLLGMSTPVNVKNPLIDLRAYYWLGVTTPVDPNNLEPTFAEIVNNPGLYNYGACGVNEAPEIKLQRLRDRFVGIDESSGTLTTIYFSLNPLCDQ